MKRFIFRFIFFRFGRKLKRTHFGFYFISQNTQKKNAHNQKLHVEWAIQEAKEKEKKRNRVSIRRRFRCSKQEFKQCN